MPSLLKAFDFCVDFFAALGFGMDDASLRK